MKKTSQLVVLAALCLNFAYCQNTKKYVRTGNTNKINHKDDLPYKYNFTGFQPGYPSGYRISNDDFMKGKSISVRNYTIIQLFALALGSGIKECPSIPPDRIVVEVRDPGKLREVKCFQLSVPFFLCDDFYIILRKCLNTEFPGYEVKMEIRGGVSVMVILDKAY